MHNSERYPFTAVDPALGEAGLQPHLPITLTYQDRSVTVSGLLHTGAMVNVLPYQVGVDLGAVWDQQTTRLRLTGNLAQFEVRGLLVSGRGTVRPRTIGVRLDESNEGSSVVRPGQFLHRVRCLLLSLTVSL